MKFFNFKKDEPVLEAVIIKLDALNLPQEIYDQYDLATLEEKLDKILRDAGIWRLRW